MVAASPLAWNRIADRLPSRGLAQDLRVEVALNGALNDAAVSVWAAKRKYQSPRPISMIRSLAFDGRLPPVHDLIRSQGGSVLVRERGRWVLATRWTPPAATPPSPGWVSERSAFAYAAARVLSALTKRSYAARAGAVARSGLAGGIETPEDAAAGRAIGIAVANRVLQR